MKNRTKRDTRARARLLRGLSNVLKYNLDNLRIESCECETDNLRRAIRDVNETLEKMKDVIAEIEYALYLESSSR